jgi:hypothetical protein
MASATAKKASPARVLHFRPVATATVPAFRQRGSFPRGVLYGIGAALAVSLLWGLLAYQAQNILIALLSGYAIALAVRMGSRRPSPWVALVASLLAIAALLLGEIFYFSFSAMRELGAPLSWNLVSGIARDIAALELLDSNLFAALLAVLSGAALGLYSGRVRAISIPLGAAARLEKVHHSPGSNQGAIEGDRRGDPTPVSMRGQLVHRTSDDLLKDSDTDLPG